MEVRHKGWGQFMRRSEWRGEVTVRVVFFDDDVRTELNQSAKLSIVRNVDRAMEDRFPDLFLFLLF